MKNIFIIAALLVMTSINAQVIIGNTEGTATDKTSVLLEFAVGNKGMIVPYVRSLPAIATAGTILLDASSETATRMKFFNGTVWIDLSGQDANISSALTIQPTTEQAPELADAKTIIGARSSIADGALVLESTSKAMVLPTVTDVQNIHSPSPGMMVYVKKANAKRLAIFNGSKWSFWKMDGSL